MISFRVSEEEFRTLAEVCLSQGFQSYSDLVRTAVQELLSNRAGRGPALVQSAMESLTRRIELLDHDLKELIGHSRASSPGNG
jgi:Arc/MetJ-type ribon-helix-helix transcriptional regulator